MLQPQAGACFWPLRKETTHDPTSFQTPTKGPASQTPPLLDVVGPMNHRITTKELLDLVEAATGTRKLVLTVPEFAQLTGRDYDEIRKRAGQDIPAERDGDRGRWRIPIQALKPFLEGRCAA